MGVPFQVDVNVVTHAEQIDALEKRLNALQSKGVDLKVKVDGLDKLDTSKMGKQASQNFSRAFNSSSGKTKINSPIDFARLKVAAQKEVKGISGIIQSGLGLSEKESDKIAQSYVNTAKKSQAEALKTRQKAYQQEQKAASANLKQQLANVEKLNQNKANIITARANGKSSTVDALREERKAIKAEQKQLQKEAERYNNIPGYSQNERAKAITAKQLGTKSLVDKAWASVQDKDSAAIEKRFNSELAKAQKQLQTSISKNDYADGSSITQAQNLLNSMKNMKVSDYQKPLDKIAEVTQQVQGLSKSLSSTHKTNLDNLNKEIKAEEQNVKQTQKAQQSWNNIQAQQKISQLGYDNRVKNAHNQEIMNRIQQTRQKYEGQADQLKNIQQRATSGEFEARTAKNNAWINKYAGQNSESLTKAREQIEKINALQKELQTGKYGSGDKKGLQIVSDDQIAKAKELDQTCQELKNTMTQVANEESKTLGQGVAERSANSVASYMENNTKALKKYGEQLTTLQQQYKSATTEFEKSDLDNQFKNLKSRISAEGLTGRSGWDEFKRAGKQIAQFAGIYGALQNVMIQAPSDMVKAVKDYDSAMVNMQMATGVSNNQVKELMNTYADMGKQLKVTGVDVATSATEWMKQGKTIEESNKLAQDSIVLSRIGDLSSDDATRTITAAMKSYNLNESQVMDFIDQISAIDMASATDVGGLADAFNEVAANANQAGISTKQLLSYAAVIGETTQEGMSSVGTSLNAIFSRMGNIKLARLKDYQNGGEDLSNVETVLKGVGISLRDADGEFKNFGDVLDETAEKYSTFGTVKQRAVAQAFAG